MNEETIQGEGRDIGGKLTETAGDALGDHELQASGLADQLTGKAQKVVGSLKEAFADGSMPLIDRLRAFAKERPILATTVAGIASVALLNTLRGKTR